MRNHRRLITYALALAVPLCTWAQTETEPNNNWNQNNPVAEGSSMSGSIGICSPTDNSADWFELNLTQLGQLKINTSMSNDGPAPVVSLALYNENASQIASFNLTSGENGASALDSIFFTCRGTGTYYLRFDAPGGCLSYTFSYSVVQPVFGADNEDNGNWNTANTDTVAVNTNADGRINFSQNDDNSDYFILELDDDGILNVHIQAEHVDASTQDSLTVRLYDSGVALKKTWRVGIGANSTPLASTVNIPCRGNEQRYFLQFASDACGTSYRFSYDVTPPVFADDNEDNDNWNSANTDTVAVGTDQDGRLDFYNDDNSDYHILTLDDDGILNVHIQAEHVDASSQDSLTVRLYNTGVALQKTWRVGIGANSTPLASTVSIPCRGNEQRYFLQFASDACGTTYRFSYDVTPPVFADDNEDNDNWNTTNTDTVAVSTDADGRLNFNYDDNSDFHILTLDDDGILNVHIQAEHVDASLGDSLTVRLYNSGIALQKTWRVGIGANSTALDSTVHMTCRGNEERYFLQFASDACGTSYRFSYDVTPPVFADDNEDNDNWNTANTDTVDVGADQDGRLNFNYDDNSDYHILTLDDDGILNIHIQAEHVDTSTQDSLTVRLYNSGLALQKTWRVGIGANSTALDSTVHMTCRGNEERYFLQFVSDACGTSYRFSYDVTSPFFADDNEENDNWNSANTDTIFLDSAAVTGRLAFYYDDNSDFYKVVLATPGTITVDSRAENADAAGTYEVRLYNSGVSQIGTHTYPVGGSSSPASDSWTSASLAAGTYYLQALNAPCGTSYSFLCNDDDDDGVCNGFDLCPGTPNGEGVNVDGCSCSQVTVDDGDPCTLDECLNGDVTHTFQDADGDLTCDANDGCPNDPNKTSAGACGCGNPDVPTTWYADSDGDGLGDPNDSQAGFTCDQPVGYVADNTDLCPSASGTVGSACDDGNPNTSGDVIDANCECHGTPGGCSNDLTLEFQNDNNPGQVTWEVWNEAGDVLVLNGPDPVPANQIGTQALCLPDGCYQLRILDSGGDGMTTGGYELRTQGTNERIIDNTNNFGNGSVSTISGNQTFCLPLGTDMPIHSSCDKLDWVNNKFIVCHANAAVTAEYGVTNATSGYEFWFYDPNGSYSFRRFRSHSTSDGYGSGATRACHFKVNGWINSPATPHLPANMLLNVRVRGRVAGNNLAFGPACQFRIGAALAACPRVSLQDDPANVSDFSCGVTREFGGASRPANRIYADPPQPIPVVPSANVRYQFRFRITGEGVCIVRPPQKSARMVLNWTSGTPLECSKTYEVDVRVSLDAGATWCFGPGATDQASTCADTEDWGKVCLVSISGCDEMDGGGDHMAIHGDGQFTLYPNPNHGDQLFVSLSQVQEGVQTVNVDIFDLTGKRVSARTIPVQDGSARTNLNLNGDLSGGMYMVHVTVGDRTYTERLVIQP